MIKPAVKQLDDDHKTCQTVSSLLWRELDDARILCGHRSELKSKISMGRCECRCTLN